jgi:hemolysin D
MNTMQALGDLRDRYVRIFRGAWSTRHELDSVLRLPHENEFLPAALALRETPLHPAPRIAMGMIIALATVAVAWACLGKVDVIASAPGKIIPSGDVKTIQAQDTAVVKVIHVKNGQRVQEGDSLIDLDATNAIADSKSAESQLYATREEISRAQAMLDAIDRHHSPQMSANSVLGAPVMWATERQVLAGEYSDYVSNLGKMQADIAQETASLREVDQEIQKLVGTLPIEERKERDYAILIAKGYVGMHDYYAEQQAVIQMKQDLAAQRAKRSEAQAALDSASRKRDAYVADVRRTWLEKIHDDNEKAGSLEQDIVKANQQQKLMHLTAPVDGTVQQLAVHTIGGVVTPAQPLLTVVPDSKTMLVEAIVDNQDIGFVKEGQTAEIKVEAFPFTRYGMLHGRVVQVSNDAKQDDKLGLIFTAEIALPRETMQIDGRPIHLTPGMAVTAEIKTGRRRIISYLLSPLVQHANESLHER